MQQAKICVQAMTIKDSFTTLGAYETLKKVSELGYNCVELSQVPMDSQSVLDMKRGCEDFKIEVCAISGIPSSNDPNQETILTHFDKFISDCQNLSCNYIRIGMIPYYYLSNKEALLTFCANTRKAAKQLEHHDIKLYYHNHHMEFLRFDGVYAMDIIKDEIPSIGLELDVHWLQRAGIDPISYIKNNKGRVDLLHLKDYKIKNVPHDVIQKGDWDAFSTYFNDCICFAEIGEGNLNMKGIIETALECGSKYLIIEQDNTYDKTPFESLAISRDNLIKIGYEKLF